MEEELLASFSREFVGFSRLIWGQVTQEKAFLYEEIAKVAK